MCVDVCAQVPEEAALRLLGRLFLTVQQSTDLLGNPPPHPRPPPLISSSPPSSYLRLSPQFTAWFCLVFLEFLHQVTCAKNSTCGHVWLVSCVLGEPSRGCMRPVLAFPILKCVLCTELELWKDGWLCCVWCRLPAESWRDLIVMFKRKTLDHKIIHQHTYVRRILSEAVGIAHTLASNSLKPNKFVICVFMCVGRRASRGCGDLTRRGPSHPGPSPQPSPQRSIRVPYIFG